MTEDQILKVAVSELLKKSPPHPEVIAGARGLFYANPRVHYQGRLLDQQDVVEVAAIPIHAHLFRQATGFTNITAPLRESVERVVERVGKLLVGVEGEISLDSAGLHQLVLDAFVLEEMYGEAQAAAFQISLSFGVEPSKGLQVRLIRRNGTVVPWSASKIEMAVRQAFLSQSHNPGAAIDIAQAVTARVKSAAHAFVHIEDVQDMVQDELMKQGHYDTATHYILYRAERARLRGAGEEPAEFAPVIVIGEGAWNIKELRKRISFASIGLDLNLKPKQIERELLRSLGGEISRSDLRATVILNAKTLIEKDADFSKFAGRILLTYIYEEVLGWSILQDGVGKLRAAHQNGFASYLRRAVKAGRVSPELLERYTLSHMAKAIDYTADLDFDYLGLQTLYDRYLLVDKSGDTHRRLEVPQFFWMRVAMGLFQEEENVKMNVYGNIASPAEVWAIRLYNLYKGRRFCSSTPTLFNSGTNHSQLSSCYISFVDDSIESIFDRGIQDSALLSKWAGGLGGSWSAVRGMGARIRGTNGESQGVIPFLKVFDAMLNSTNQGGKRKGSGCVYLATWHSDIEDFLDLRKNVGDERRRTHDTNTANWIPDLFMKRLEARETWSLFRSNEVPDLVHLYGKAFEQRYAEYEAMAADGKIWSKTLPAVELWRKMLNAIFETGHPWMTWSDPCNVRSPQDHCGVVHSSNLCSEIVLNTDNEQIAVCNLGSVVLESHITPEGAIDHKALRETITVAIRALDNVVDINFYPVPAAKLSNVQHRPIGLGMMGLQNALYKRGAVFASEGAVEFNDELTEAVAFYAYSASCDLAREKGAYSSYAGSKWDRGILPQDTIDLLQEERGVPILTPREGKLDWEPLRAAIRAHGMRNSNVMATAPTATIGIIMGSSPCIEPNYKNLYVKSNMGGEFTQLNGELVRDLKTLNLWDQAMLDQLKYHDGELDLIPGIPQWIKDKHATAFGIPYEFILDAAERRQKWIDQSQSLNLWLKAPDLKVLSRMYREAWARGLKTTYYLRTTSGSAVEKSTLDVSTIQSPARTCDLEARARGEECESCS